MNEFFGGGFPVAARNGDERNGELLPVKSGQFLQSRKYVGNEDGFAFNAVFRFINDRIGSPAFERLRGKPIPVEIRSFEGEKKVAVLQLPGVGLNGRVGLVDGIKRFDLHRYGPLWQK